MADLRPLSRPRRRVRHRPDRAHGRRSCRPLDLRAHTAWRTWTCAARVWSATRAGTRTNRWTVSTQRWWWSCEGGPPRGQGHPPGQGAVPAGEGHEARPRAPLRAGRAGDAAVRVGAAAGAPGVPRRDRGPGVLHEVRARPLPGLGEAGDGREAGREGDPRARGGRGRPRLPRRAERGDDPRLAVEGRRAPQAAHPDHGLRSLQGGRLRRTSAPRRARRATGSGTPAWPPTRWSRGRAASTWSARCAAGRASPTCTGSPRRWRSGWSRTTSQAHPGVPEGEPRGQDLRGREPQRLRAARRGAVLAAAEAEGDGGRADPLGGAERREAALRSLDGEERRQADRRGR